MPRFPAAPGWRANHRYRHRGVEASHATAHGVPRAQQGCAPCVVEVQTDVGADRVEQRIDASRRGHAGGVGKGELLDAGGPAHARRGPRRSRRRCHRCRASRTRTTPPVDQALSGDLDDFGQRPDRPIDRHLHVVLVVDRARRQRDRQRVDLGLEGEFRAFAVGHQRPVAHTRAAVDRRHDLGGARHRRHGRRRNERNASTSATPAATSASIRLGPLGDGDQAPPTGAPFTAARPRGRQPRAGERHAVSMPAPSGGRAARSTASRILNFWILPVTVIGNSSATCT